MFREFKDFVNRGNVITIAVGLVMALYFQKIVDALHRRGDHARSSPPSSARTSFEDIGFGIGDARISIGLVIQRRSASSSSRSSCSSSSRRTTPTSPSRTKKRRLETELSLLTEIRDELRSGTR